MARRVSRATRVELISAVRERHLSAARVDKVRILDEFTAVTGYHRKHGVRLLLGEQPHKAVAAGQVRSRRSDEGVRQAVLVLWEAADRVCGKRRKPLMPTLVRALERYGHLELEELVRQRVLSASAATLDWLLRSARGAVRGRKARARALPAVRRKSVSE